MSNSYEKKARAICLEFGKIESPEALYHALIALGQKQPRLASKYKRAENKIAGCQSTAYIQTEFKDGLIYFHIEADALISAGMAQLVSHLYSGESPEVILTCPPECFKTIGLESALSPSRSNGLSQILLRCKQEALACLTTL